MTIVPETLGLQGLRDPRRYRLALAIIAILAFTLRLAVAAAFQGLTAEPNFNAQPDQVDYEQLAFSLSADLGYSTPAGVPTASRPPETSFAIYPVYLVFGRSFGWARVWFCFLSAVRSNAESSRFLEFCAMLARHRTLVGSGTDTGLAGEPPRRLVLMTPILATCGTATVFYGSIRFRDSIAPIFIVLAAGALARRLQFTKRRAVEHGRAAGFFS